MPGDGSHDLVVAGRRLRKKLVVALTLSSAVPLLVLAYVVRAFVLPSRAAGDSLVFGGVQALVAFTVIGMIAGAYIIWDVGRTVARIAEMLASERAIAGLGRRKDEVGTVMTSFNRMLETIEQQAGEINSFATRLDAAYKELESTNARLKETSFKDEVTGLYNRRFFSLRLEEELSRYRRFNHPVSVVLLDLDGFKAVNDDLGHAVGDDTLRDVAQILMKHSRGINVVSRYGGDEFAVLLVETSKSGARLYADRIRQVVATFPYSHGKRVTASFGVASLPDDEASTSEELFRAADGALYDVKPAIASLKLGAYDFIMKPVNVDELLIAADRALERRQLLIEHRHYQELLERRVEEATRGLAQLNRELQDAYRTTLEALGSALDTRDVGTESHSRRVHGYAMATARVYGVPEPDLPALAHGVLLHDIGKIGIPDGILLKPGPLTDDEWKIMRRHPEIGKQLIEKIPFLQGAVPIVYSHHEKWDGSGYPRGLRGEEIPLGARIFMVVDAFDAITFDRPYSKAQPFDVAKAEIKRCAGKHFDPDVVTAFFNVPEALLAEIRRKSVEP